MNRFFLTKLVLRGENLLDATLTFSAGFNAVTGSSDTGKSLAYHAIEYALGASKMPALPPEADGYDRVFLELYNTNGQIYTVMRSLMPSESTKVCVFKAALDQLDVGNFDEYSTSSKARSKYSDFLMSLFDCTYSTLLLSGGETSQAFTFRAFAHLIMLSETKVYALHSPIYESDIASDVSRPPALAAFHVLLKGKDEPAPPKKEKPAISKAKLEGQKEQLEELCSGLEQEIIALKATLGGWDFQNIEQEISRIEKDVAKQRHKLESIQNDFTSKKQTILELDEKRVRMRDTILRMELLRKNYESDIERLDFINEARALTDQFVDINCPICHSSLSSQASDIEKERFYNAIGSEKEKLSKQLADLSSAILDFVSEEHSLVADISITNIAIDEAKAEIDSLLNKGLGDALRELEHYYASRDIFVEAQRKSETLYEYQQFMDELLEKLKNIKKHKSDSFPLPTYLDELGIFCHYAFDYLSQWQFANSTVTFNQSEQDLVVGVKNKRAFGQGARAIINSAFVLSLLDYSLQKGYAHPGFVVIDSPLTTYKDKEKGEDDVSTTVKQLFYNNLAEVSKDRQIIIFDNEEPFLKNGTSVYHHFSGNQDIGRAGFIPPREYPLLEES